jgi:hypothetical protein
MLRQYWATTPIARTTKMIRKGRPSSDTRRVSSDSFFAVTLKVGLLGLSITETTAGSR